VLDTVPVLDVGPFLRGAPAGAALPAAIAQACEQIGFFTIVGHGVDPELVARTLRLAREFFALPIQEKAAVRPARPGQPRGFRAIGDEGLAYTRAEAAAFDLKEVFQVGPAFDDSAYYRAPDALPHFIPNVYPARPEGMAAAVEAYYGAMERLATQLMEACALALGLPRAWFVPKIDRHISALRIIHYPPQPDAPAAGQLRAGAHSDYGTLTLLLSENVSAGLQVLNKRGDWVDVHAPPGSYVINVGDLLMRWTNDRWISTLHRVVNPPAERAAADRRLSLVFFHHPNYDAEVRCIESCLAPGESPKYPPVNAGPYRVAKYAQARGGGDAAAAADAAKAS
jgi:isopenicillin N synthase-like dioxygenase